MTIRAARADDWAAVAALLERCGLPLEGVADQFGPNYALADGAVAGVEVYGEYGLLRSVAVDPAVQGRGIGRVLVQDRIAWARERGLRALYLLTSTAPDFFAALGFERVPRESVPGEVQAAREFRSTCPASATVMRLALRAGG